MKLEDVILLSTVVDKNTLKEQTTGLKFVCSGFESIGTQTYTVNWTYGHSDVETLRNYPPINASGIEQAQAHLYFIHAKNIYYLALSEKAAPVTEAIMTCIRQEKNVRYIFADAAPPVTQQPQPEDSEVVQEVVRPRSSSFRGTDVERVAIVTVQPATNGDHDEAVTVEPRPNNNNNNLEVTATTKPARFVRSIASFMMPPSRKLDAEKPPEPTAPIAPIAPIAPPGPPVVTISTRGSKVRIEMS